MSTLFDELSSRTLRFSIIASNDRVSAKDLKDRSEIPVVWMTGAAAEAGSILAVYVPKKHPDFELQSTGYIRYLFSLVRSTYPRPTYKFSAARARHVAIAHRPVELGDGPTAAEFRADDDLKRFANAWRTIGRSKKWAPSKDETGAFWRLVLKKNPRRKDDLNRQLLAPPPHPQETLYTPDRSKKYSFDAAISCSGKDWRVTDELYRRLTSCGMRVYYYRSTQSRDARFAQEEAGQDADRGLRILEEIRDVYGSQALLFIPVLSANYFDSTHGSREWAQSMVRGYEHMVPVRLDDSPSPAMIGQVPSYRISGVNPKWTLDDVVDRVSRRLLDFPAQGWRGCREAALR